MSDFNNLVDIRFLIVRVPPLNKPCSRDSAAAPGRSTAGPGSQRQPSPQKKRTVLFSRGSFDTNVPFSAISVAKRFSRVKFPRQV